MPTTITLSGFKEFEKKCQDLPGILLDELDGEVEDASRTWATLAKQDAPTDQGFLKGQISNKKVGIANWEVVSLADYSAYLEWGTRTKVNVPPDLAAYAAQFRGAGIGKDAKKFIYAWCDRVGIPKDKQWIVYISIMVKGINPHPYFFIQVPLVEKQFLTNAQKVLNTEH